MTTAPFVLHSIHLRDASEAEYTALNTQINHMRAERLPDDPPLALNETTQSWRNSPPFLDLQSWVVWDVPQREILARGEVILPRLEGNEHLAQFEIAVLPSHRRQGMGRALLEQIARAAQADGRRLLIAETSERIPAGADFLLRAGAQKGLESHVNQLRLADLDQQQLAAWLIHGEQHAADFELGFWDGAYPEARLADVSDLYELTNQQPMGEIDIKEIHFTPQQIRQMEQQIFAGGAQRWTFYLIHRPSGKFAGFTETVWNPNRPELLRQLLTGVFPQFRNQGLGRWLKAAMIKKTLDERPQVKFIRTGNADSNAAMLKINTELGFQPYSASAVWQMSVETVLQSLSRTNQGS